MDWVGLVEAIYDLETPSHDEWLLKLARTVGPRMVPRGAGHSVSSLFYVDGDRLLTLGSGLNDVDRDYMERSGQLFAENPDMLLKCFRDGRPAASMSTNCGARDFRRSTYSKWFHPIGERDAFGLLARDGGNWGVCIATGLSKVTRFDQKKAAPWARIAAHIHAAMRLRFRAHGAPPVPSAPSVALQIGVDAVLTP